MIEYLYDAIRAVAGQEITVSAIVTDEQEQPITSGCCFILHDKDKETMIATCNGTYLPEHLQWEFTIPAEVTAELRGHYWYCVQHNGQNMCFKQPIYLV